MPCEPLQLADRNGSSANVLHRLAHFKAQSSAARASAGDENTSESHDSGHSGDSGARSPVPIGQRCRWECPQSTIIADMSKITLAVGIIVALEILTAARAAHAPVLELDSCHDDLDRLRRTASDASDSAE